MQTLQDHHLLRHRQQPSHQPHLQERPQLHRLWRFPSSTTTAPGPFHYNVVAFGKQGHFAKPLQKGTRIKLVVQAQFSAGQHRHSPAY